MRINSDGTSSVVLGLVHATCVTQTFAGYNDLFAGGRPTHDPVDLEPARFCWNCRRPFRPDDKVALQGVLA